MKDQLSELTKLLDQSLEYLDRQLAKVQDGRVSSAVLDGVQIEAYSVMTDIKQLATIKSTDATTLVITPFDRSQFDAIVSGINDVNLDANSSDDGSNIYLKFGSMTTEKREELVKSIKATGEDIIVSMRNSRRDILSRLKAMKTDSEISEDEYFAAEKEVQKNLDEHIASVNDRIDDKSESLLKI